jgi:hypothetical protein
MGQNMEFSEFLVKFCPKNGISEVVKDQIK